MTPFRDAPALPPALLCPRDRSELTARVAEGATLHACPRCAGLWVDAATFAALRADTAAMDGLALHPLATPSLDATFAPDTAPPVDCPRCSRRCERRAIGAEGALVVDTCREHGLWLDGGELHALLRHERGERRRPSPPPPRTFEQDESRVKRIVGVLAALWFGFWP